MYLSPSAFVRGFKYFHNDLDLLLSILLVKISIKSL